MSKVAKKAIFLGVDKENVSPIDISTEEKFKIAKVKVLNCVQKFGIVGFNFNGVPCQITVAPDVKIGEYIEVKYTGNIKDGIKFSL